MLPFLNTYYRIIKMSSPRLNNVIVVGCMMTYFSVILFGLDGGLISTEQYGNVCIVSSDISINCLSTYLWRNVELPNRQPNLDLGYS